MQAINLTLKEMSFLYQHWTAALTTYTGSRSSPNVNEQIPANPNLSRASCLSIFLNGFPRIFLLCSEIRLSCQSFCKFAIPYLKALTYHVWVILLAFLSYAHLKLQSFSCCFILASSHINQISRIRSLKNMQIPSVLFPHTDMTQTSWTHIFIGNRLSIQRGLK